MGPARSKTPFVIAAALTVVLTAAGVFFVLNKKNKSSAASDNPPPDNSSGTVVSMDKGTTPPDPMGSAGSTVPDVSPKGSAATPPPDVQAKGSAVTIDKGSAATPPPDVQAKGSAATPPPDNKGSAAEVALSTVTINSNPPGGDIYINGAAAGKKTPSTMTMPRGDYKIAVKLKGFEDYKKSVSIKAETFTVDATMKKPSGSGKGSGKGSGGKTCDTCLERPD